MQMEAGSCMMLPMNRKTVAQLLCKKVALRDSLLLHLITPLIFGNIVFLLLQRKFHLQP